MPGNRLNLHAQQYDYNTLKTNIYDVSLVDILKTQKLTANFCHKYILNKDYQLTPEEQSITIYDVLKCQPHLSINDFLTTFSRQNSYDAFDNL